MLKYRWEETGLHGKVTETANDWNDIGRQAFQQPDGKGSTGHDFAGMVRRIITSFSVAGWNEDRGGTDLSVMTGGGAAAVDAWILFTLLWRWKKSANSGPISGLAEDELSVSSATDTCKNKYLWQMKLTVHLLQVQKLVQNLPTFSTSTARRTRSKIW